MIVKRLTLMTLALVSFSVQAKTFRFQNSQTGQVMSVHCFFPNSVQCQNKIEEVKQRLRNSTNPDQTTLSGARAADAAGNVRDGAVQMGTSLRDGAVDAGTTVRDGAVDAGRTVRDGAVEAGQAVGDFGSRVASGVREQADHAGNVLANGANAAREAVVGRTYRVRVPGIEHSMTFHCRGGLESEECKEEKDMAVVAIRGGSTAESLDEFRQTPAYRAREFASETATTVREGTLNTISRMNHNYCKDKLERHARDFDEEYERTETQLVSYTEKIAYIEEKLREEGKLEECQVHFDHAVLGYQLRWIQRGEIAQEKTHIFDGLGRLGDGGVGYWKNEERQTGSSAQAM